jgi:hypothetical protein
MSSRVSTRTRGGTKLFPFHIFTVTLVSPTTTLDGLDGHHLENDKFTNNKYCLITTLWCVTAKNREDGSVSVPAQLKY